MKKILLFTLALGLVSIQSCDDYDDAALKEQITELGDRVDAHDVILKELQEHVKSLNDANAAFTELLNGSWIKEVKETEENGRKKLEIVIGNSQGQTTYTIYDGKNGEDGEPGQNGQDGNTPQLDVAKDEDGRYYWTLDGEPLLKDGQKVYASGEKGEPGQNGTNGQNGQNGKDGKDGITPVIKVDKDKNTPDDQKYYWWVSTDGKELTDETKEWIKLTPITSFETGGGQPGSGLNMTYDKQKGQITFESNGERFTFSVQTANFTVSGTDQNHFYRNQTREYECEFGDADNCIIKASLQNEDNGFSVSVSGKKISVTAKETGAKNIVDVELVKQDGTCKHHYFEVVSDVYTASLTATKGLVLTGTREYTGSIAVKLDYSAPEKINVKIEVETTLPEGSLKMENSLEISSAETNLSYTIDGTKLEAGKAYTLKVKLSSEGIHIDGDGTYDAVIGSEMTKLDMKAENYSSPLGVESETNGVGTLCDGLDGTNGGINFGTPYWDVPEFATYSEEIKTYGVWIDVTTPEKVKALKFRFQQRGNENGKVREYKIGSDTNDEEKEIGVVLEGTASDQGDNAWNETAGFLCTQKARFGVTKSYASGKEHNLTTEPQGSFALSELEVYGLK